MSSIERLVRLMPEPRSTRDLRSFGLVMTTAAVVVGVWPVVFRGEPARAWLLVLAAATCAAALAWPRMLRHPYRAWMLLGHLLGWVNSRILMTVLFLVLVTPVALVMRFFGRDALLRRFDPAAKTYRVVREPRPASHMQHPF